MPDYLDYPQSLIRLFEQGSDRDIPKFAHCDDDLPVLNLGAGNKKIFGAVSLDWPDWNAETDPLPYNDESVGGILAYHFLEHLRDPRPVLRECSRVLVPGAPMNIVVPHYLGSIAFHDLDHKSFYTADTWRNLLNQPYYEKDRTGFNFKIGANLIMGLTERNLMLVTQLIKR